MGSGPVRAIFPRFDRLIGRTQARTTPNLPPRCPHGVGRRGRQRLGQERLPAVLPSTSDVHSLTNRTTAPASDRTVQYLSPRPVPSLLAYATAALARLPARAATRSRARAAPRPATPSVRPGRLLEEGGRGTRRRTVPAMERRTGPPMVRLRGQPTAQRRSGRPRRPERLGQRTARPMAPRWAPRSERLSRMEYRRQGSQRGRQIGQRWRLLGSSGDLETRSRPFHLPVKTS